MAVYWVDERQVLQNPDQQHVGTTCRMRGPLVVIDPIVQEGPHLVMAPPEHCGMLHHCELIETIKSIESFEFIESIEFIDLIETI